MKLQEASVPLCTAGEEKLAGEPGGRRGWSRRQAERAVETPPATHTRKKEQVYRQRKKGREEGKMKRRKEQQERIMKTGKMRVRTHWWSFNEQKWEKWKLTQFFKYANATQPIFKINCSNYKRVKQRKCLEIWLYLVISNIKLHIIKLQHCLRITHLVRLKHYR